MAVVRPFRALRYDPAVAGPLESLVAPPFDVIDAEQRDQLLGRSAYNVVHLTLPDSEEEAAACLAQWREQGALVQDPEPACWWLAQEYVGPDGVARRREGFVAALRAEPYENRVVLPHERTHAGPKEGRLRLLRATRTQLEPLFFLWDGTVEVDGLGEPDLQSGGDSLWRLDAEFSEALVEELADAQLLIADGHHRYETTLASGEPWVLAVIVPMGQEGLTIFPTHRVAPRIPDELIFPPHEDAFDVDDAVGALPTIPGPAYAIYTSDGFRVYRPQEHMDESAVEHIHEYDLGDVTYTPDPRDAVARVDAGEGEGAILVAPTSLQRVFDLARRGEVMPQKSTFFYPKLTSGLLMLPLDQ